MTDRCTFLLQTKEEFEEMTGAPISLYDREINSWGGCVRLGDREVRADGNRVFGGNLNGTSISVSVAGHCEYESVSLSANCVASLCSATRHKLCPFYKKAKENGVDMDR